MEKDCPNCQRQIAVKIITIIKVKQLVEIKNFMKTNLLLFTFILFGTALNAQTKSISTLTDSLANYTFYEYSDMGELHRNPDLWAVTSNLDSIATNNDLLMLLSHESEIVNCYAFHFLVSREEDMFDNQ